MEWRKQWEVDKLSEWDPPQILNDYLPHGLCGFDKDGAPGKFFSLIFKSDSYVITMVFLV